MRESFFFFSCSSSSRPATTTFSFFCIFSVVSVLVRLFKSISSSPLFSIFFPPSQDHDLLLFVVHLRSQERLRRKRKVKQTQRESKKEERPRGREEERERADILKRNPWQLVYGEKAFQQLYRDRYHHPAREDRRINKTKYRIDEKNRDKIDER